MCLYKLIAYKTIPIDHIFLMYCSKNSFFRIPKTIHTYKCKYAPNSVIEKKENLNFLDDSSKFCAKIEQHDIKKNEDDVILNDKQVLENELFASISESNKTRFNEINLQMLSSKLHQQIFGNTENIDSLNEKDVFRIKKELTDYGIATECTSQSPNVDISIPPLCGSNIQEHFNQIASEQVEPYLNVIGKLMNDLPPIPKKFLLKEGWTRYSGSVCEPVEYPPEDALIFDVEVSVKSGPFPTLATAVSSSCWYGWVSKQLIEEATSSFKNKHLSPDILIPLESSKDDQGLNLNQFQQMPKVIVGHNVSFDRIRVKEQYWLNGSGTRFLDTMSLHISVSGTSSYQRAILRSKDSGNEDDDLQANSSLNNLADVYKLYCGEKLDKKTRDVFVEGDLHQIKEQFNELMLYCASDVAATHKVLKAIFPMFQERFPHPATLAGMLELSSTYLPVNNNWKRYIEESDTTFNDLNLESKICLSKKADQMCRLALNERYKQDPWMWDEDWAIRDIKMKKGFEKYYKTKKKEEKKDKEELKEKFEYLTETRNFLPKKMPHMPGYPNWYRKLCFKQDSAANLFPKAQKISNAMLVTPKLLNLTWNGYPLHHIKEHGWGFIIPYQNVDYDTNLPLEQIWNLIKSNENLGLNCNIELNSNLSDAIEREFDKSCPNQFFSKNLRRNSKVNDQPDADVDNSCHFYKLPHKNGLAFNVGNPLSKDFLSKLSENVLAGVDASASRILEISKLSSYWKNNRDRILSQLVVWLDNKNINPVSRTMNNQSNMGAIIPQVVVSGTVTRRAVEPTWMTASNAHSDRIGSELRAMINAPPNYNIVGADVDSQELWIASIIGDAFANDVKIQGATPFSWMTLIGSKSQGTDMHSVTAKAIGISRDEAKIINYARIYGAGQKFAERLLKQFNPTMSTAEAASKSKKMFSITKGQRFLQLRKEYISECFIDKPYSTYEAYKISRILGKPKDEVFERSRWIGGSESAMFNSLEEIASQKQPSTPFLNSRLSRALELENDDKNLPTKINWVVQSSAVDFLHLILVCMRWLMKDKARLCLTFHDEVRYLVPSKYKYNAALAMHVTNLLVRSFFVSRLEMKDLPMSVAFFTAVEVDSVLRKEATQDCKTPSNPHGLLEGYGINYGENLNIWSAIDKSRGCVGINSSKLKNNPNSP